jgi:hypothetical protein
MNKRIKYDEDRSEEYDERDKQMVVRQIQPVYYEKDVNFTPTINTWYVQDLCDIPERVGGHGGRLKNEVLLTYIKMRIQVEETWSSIVKYANMRIMVIVNKERNAISSAELPSNDHHYTDERLYKVLVDEWIQQVGKVTQSTIGFSGIGGSYSGSITASRYDFEPMMKEYKRKLNVYRKYYDTNYVDIKYEGNVYLVVKTDFPRLLRVQSRLYYKG